MDTTPRSPLAAVGDAVGPARLQACRLASPLIEVWDAVSIEGDRRLRVDLYPDPKLAAIPVPASAGALVEATLERGVAGERTYVVVDPAGAVPLVATTLARTEVPRLLGRLAVGLERLHAAGAAHGLIAPASVAVAVDGRPQLLHWGLARWLAAQSGVGAPPGLLAGAAPELLAGGRPDVACDVYGFGVLLFGLLTGELPQPGDRPGQLRGDLGPAVDRLFAGCYVRRDRRLPSMQALIEELGIPVGGDPDDVAERFAVALVARRESPAAGGVRLRSSDPLPPARRVDPPSPEVVQRLGQLLRRHDDTLRDTTRWSRGLIPLATLAATVVLYPHFSWTALACLPLGFFWRMLDGDMRQKRCFDGQLLGELTAFCEAEQVPRIYIWQHVSERQEQYAYLWTWLAHAEEVFLPESLQAPPRRMGGVSKVPYT